MSGGSYNYLCQALAWRHAGLPTSSDEHVLKMLGRLSRDYPDSRATEDFKSLVAALKTAERLGEALYAVLENVEWSDSGDRREDSVQAAIAQYEKPGE